MNEYEKYLQEQQQKKADVKEVLKRLHRGETPSSLKREFSDIIKGLKPDEIARIESELIEDGTPVEEVHRLCDVHIEVFKENLENAEEIAPPGHPVHTLMSEHSQLMTFASDLKQLATGLRKAQGHASAEDELELIAKLIQKLGEAESHHVREENVLFPYLEKHGITQPAQIMWTEHDNIRDVLKKLRALLDSVEETDFGKFTVRLNGLSVELAEIMESNFYKENNILYPTSIKIMNGREWKDVREQFDELGYTSFTPTPPDIEFEDAGEDTTVPARDPGSSDGIGIIEFETGKLNFEEMESLMDTLPVDITFVDKDDRVKYFSQSPERIFPRAKAIIGRTVQNCHPQKSLDKVTAILEGFKQGKKEPAEFWINMGEMTVYIRYFPVHNKKGEYLGTLEVTQNIAPIKKIEGEKRLL